MAKADSRRIKKVGANLKSDLKPDFKIGVFGAGGRMGLEVLAALKEATGKEPFLAVEPNRQKLSALNTVSDLTDPLCKKVQLWIEFSSPQGFSEIYEFCKKNKSALVSGTTGLSKAQLKDISKPSIPLLWSPNMSLGINILLKAMKSLEGVEEFDFQIEEFHHKHKKDKPSGTALLLQEELEKVVGRSLEKPLSIRGGGIFGIHKVWAMSTAETLTFEHQALNRSVFANGAVKAAAFLQKQKPGLYSLQHLLSER